MLSGRFLLYPTDVSILNKVKTDCFNIAGFSNVIGAIEGTHIKVQAPSTHEPKTTTVTMWRQSVMLNCVACQDQPMTQEFWGIHKFMMHLRKKKCKLCIWETLVIHYNPGFSHPSWSLNCDNTAHAETRNVSERCFGVLKWRFLLSAWRVHNEGFVT